MNPISFASGIVPEFGPVDTIEAARAGGFDMVGLWVDPLEWTAAHTRDARAALAATGLPLLDVEVVWIKPDSIIDDHRKIIDVGTELGAANVLCVSSDPDHARTAAHLATLCRHAEASGMRVALEFGIFTEVKDLTAALAILDQVAHPLRALLIDPIHVDRSGTTVAQIAKVDPALLPYAQFCDARALRPDPADFDAVINPPHGSILAVGAGIKKPVVLKDGTVGVATVMSMTLSVDHRVIDGALGAEFLKAIVENLENPITMLA
ncbi:MAG: xylose isomerase [Rhodobacterales bacterium 17-64-5]|nr:MAG: xylose isomerase [Rhodobacterales bacterium 17-64-5]